MDRLCVKYARFLVAVCLLDVVEVVHEWKGSAVIRGRDNEIKIATEYLNDFVYMEEIFWRIGCDWCMIIVDLNARVGEIQILDEDLPALNETI